MQKIMLHLWYDQEALEAANFYTSLFEDSEVLHVTTIHDTPSGDAQIVSFNLAGQDFMAISAGPEFKFTPSISLRVDCSSIAESEMLWERLLEDGQTLMPLQAYDFSPCYGWGMDRYGLSWQIMTVPEGQSVGQKITPTLMFTGEQCGKAEEAVNDYMKAFSNSEIFDIVRYDGSEGLDQPDTVKFMSFELDGVGFAAMDSAYEHQFGFNEAISLLVTCETQAEIDELWECLSADFHAEACGWLKDRFGVSWQIVPVALNAMMSQGTPEQIQRVTEAFLKMKKFDIITLEKAYDGLQ